MGNTTYAVSTTATSHYTGALIQDAVESETIPGLRGDGQGAIKSIAVKSKQNLAWQVELYDDDGYIIEKHAFGESDGTLASSWYYYAQSVDWGIIQSLSDVVAMGIRNLSVTAKIAGASGQVVLTVRFTK